MLDCSDVNRSLKEKKMNKDDHESLSIMTFDAVSFPPGWQGHLSRSPMWPPGPDWTAQLRHLIPKLRLKPLFVSSSQIHWCPWRLSLAFPWQPSPRCCTQKITSTSFRYGGGWAAPVAMRKCPPTRRLQRFRTPTPSTPDVSVFQPAEVSTLRNGFDLKQRGHCIQILHYLFLWLHASVREKGRATIIHSAEAAHQH